ncbi:hypothetical protein PRZ48_000650 [Zasmidium cellare]|uniref:Uncharacterized protein n=1 Tax=Zasmidium cellare TaxID=395010 RepID=A0ABR0EZK4_ZASCE|nr:hypothetical protein PRZ48_000650 [Zasmidium cellare]
MNSSIWADPAPESENARDTKQNNAKPVEPTPQPDPEPPASSSLSAGASTFEPDLSAPPPDGSSADLFAQTGAQQDDLFDDVVPVESMRIRSDDDLFSEDFTPAPQPVVERSKPQHTRGTGDAPRGRGRGRGRGEGRGGQNRGGAQREARGTDTAPRGGREAQTSSPAQGAAPDNAPTGPRKETVQAVRGDRHATGGLKKPKLTEEELAEKMAKIQIKNANLTAAHARAEADAASFAEREQQAKQVAKQREKEERRDRQQMMGEREKNRMRKLKAMEGREWDAEKREDDFSKGGRFDKKGGFAGDQQDYSDGREYLYREPKQERGRGGGRGGRASEAAPRQEDFPALPAASKSTEPSEPISNQPSGKSWADQVEAGP